LNQALKDLSARKTLDEGGYAALEGGKGSYRDILKNKQEAITLEQEKRTVKNEDVNDKLIREYESRLQTNPNDLKLVRSLAEIYTEKKQFDKAFELYDRVKNSEMGNDPTLDQAIAKLKLKQFDQQIEQLNPFGPDHAAQVEQLKAQKLEFQVAECQKRVEKYPTDSAIRFEMGVLYFQIGKYSEAIQEFQKAQQNPHKRLSAMGYLAQCYAKKKMYDFAARTFENAIKEKLVFDEEKKELIYNLAGVLATMGKKAEEIEQLKLIYDVDSGYKDVAARVEASYG
jgi:tetratricopeptide (TPR) repeat protein